MVIQGIRHNYTEDTDVGTPELGVETSSSTIDRTLDFECARNNASQYPTENRRKAAIPQRLNSGHSRKLAHVRSGRSCNGVAHPRLRDTAKAFVQSQSSGDQLDQTSIW